MSKNRFFWFCCVVILALGIGGAWSCGGSGDESSGKTVGPKGSTVAGPDGVELIIPEGALTEEVQIRIVKVDGAVTGFSPLGTMYEFLPKGTQFALPVTVQVPYEPSSVTNEATLALYWSDSLSGPWTALQSTVDSTAKTVSGQTTHFSFGGAGEAGSDADGDTDGDGDAGGDADGDSDTDSDGDTDTSGSTWTDSSTGLMWQIFEPGTMPMLDGGSAILYCEDLVFRGYTDWHLPTISELRTLVRGCPKTETEGACPVTDDCLDWTTCSNDACGGCMDKPMEGPGSGGAYWPTEISDDLGLYYYWSSSFSGTPLDSPLWGIDFNTGTVNQFGGNRLVRCVR